MSEDKYGTDKFPIGICKTNEVAHSKSTDKQAYTLSTQSTSANNKDANEVHGRSGSLQELSKGPNPAQQSAIEAGLKTDLRVLAGPGSGKTYVIERRYKFLVDSGISPNSILVVTFSKAMADEMGRRIKKTCTSANLEQISTIHAFCYRVLCKWYSDSRYHGWKMPKSWQEKSQLETIIGLVWREKDKPNTQEVTKAINSSKYYGLTSDDSYDFFVSGFGRQYGEWLYAIRCQYDGWMQRSRFISFADMLYLMEKQLQTNELLLRTRLQSKFSQVIIDEAQDTNAQAMRILVTVSLEPGQNTVYEVMQ
jgi:DNA helicase-2/ATP-dependent DNA helicase PcrA